MNFFQVSLTDFADDVKLLKNITNNLSQKMSQNLTQNLSQNVTNNVFRNCDDVYGVGYRTSGVYNIFAGERFIEAFCELEQEGNNWLVRTSHFVVARKAKLWIFFTNFDAIFL